MSDITRFPEPPKKLSIAASQRFALELTSKGRSAAWVRLHGELDLESAQQLAETVEQAFSTALLVTIDLRDLTFIDSCGIYELLKADARARISGGRLVIVRGAGQVDRVLELISLSEQMEMIEL